MKAYLSEVTPLVAMVVVSIILITCIANDLNHGLVYTGITVISGLGGYSVGRFRTERIFKDKQKPPNNSDTIPS